MSRASMIISNEPSPLEGTLVLQGSGEEELREIDILSGAEGCPTSGRIHGDFAWVQVAPGTFAQIVGSALRDAGIGLSYSTDSSGAHRVTSVECPSESFSFKAKLNDISARMLELSQKQLEMARSNESKHDLVLTQLRNLRREIGLIAQHLHAPLSPEIPQLDEAPRPTDVRSLVMDGQRQALADGE